MKKRTGQGGSSTTGLLSAVVVFVGILVYATYFAFDEKVINNNGRAVLNNAAAPAIITPLASGIFDSETILNNGVDQPVTAEDSGDSKKTTRLNQDESNLPAYNVKNKAVSAEIASQGYWPAYPYSSADQIMLSHNNQKWTNLENRHYFHENGDSQGQSGGRGKLESAGDFSFSLKFKSRARMDADTDADSRLSSNMNAYNNAYYQHRNAVDPVYAQYYYRNY